MKVECVTQANSMTVECGSMVLVIIDMTGYNTTTTRPTDTVILIMHYT